MMQQEYQNNNGRTEECQGANSSNLIINYLPQALTDEEFHALFNNIGPVYSARIIRDRPTGYSYGYGFVKYKNPADAETAINELNGMALMNKHLKVAYSLPTSHDNKNINVYIKGLAPDTTNDSLKKIFQGMGTIIECRAIPDKITGDCSGIGFVLFSKKEEAEAAIKTMNNIKLQGATEPLLVKFSRTEQKKPPQYSPRLSVPAVPSLRSGPLQGGGPMRGMANMRGRNMNRYSPMMAPSFINQQQSFGFGVPQQLPPQNGFIVFIYGIGPYTTEHMLWQLCAPYGEIKRVNVIKDHSKGLGKGYGFVTYGALDEANYAIQCLNGMPYEGRMLQVSMKS